MSKPSIMVGITTWNRPSMLDKTIRAVRDTVAPMCDQVLIHDDCSDPKYHGEYQRAFKRMSSAMLQLDDANHGVAHSKNALLTQMLDDGADYLFLLEDDVTPLHEDAVLRYVEASEASGIHHFSFAHHGKANVGGPVVTTRYAEFYPHSVGAWTMFTRECLDAVGLFDENFHQAWEHVEHELRLIRAGYMPGSDVHKFPDVVGSASLLREIPNSIEKSSIRPRSDWQSNIRDGLIYWRDNKPETFAMLFGDDMPLHNYAMGIIG